MKKTRHNYTWSDIIGDDAEEGVLTPLVEDAKIKDHIKIQYIGVTMNFPRTKAFLNCNSAKQKDIYVKLWHAIKNTLQVDPTNHYTFEFTKLGQVHLHGWIKVDITDFFIMGALSDIAKAYNRILPPKYKQFRENDLNTEYRRYRSPSLCLQYYDKSGSRKDPSTIDYWIEYCEKEQ